jgi:hypothetical protein
MIQHKTFETKHSITVNLDGSNGSSLLTPDQLWQGLLLKLVHPQRFDSQIKHCHIGWLNDRQFIREQQYSTFKVEDKVSLTPQSTIFVQSLASNIDAFSLSISIETTSESQRVVHYHYQRSSVSEEGLDANKYLALAYKQTDEATIEKIKSLVSLGELM